MRPPGDLTNWCIRLALDKGAMVLKAIELELIVRRLRARHPGFYVVHTPEALPEIVIRIWFRASLFRRGGGRATGDEPRALDLCEEALDTPIRGIRGIMRATAETVTRMRMTPEGGFAKVGIPAVATTGTNMYHALLHRAVDATAVITKSVGDTVKLLCIEAGRSKIVSETRTFMEDNTPNMRHLYLYADEMTRTGRVTSVERGGLGAREHGNVLLRMAAGAPVQVVTEAALTNSRGRVYGIAGPKLLGAIPQLGTLYNGLVIDEDFVQKNTKSVDSFLDSI